MIMAKKVFCISRLDKASSVSGCQSADRSSASETFISCIQDLCIQAIGEVRDYE